MKYTKEQIDQIIKGFEGLTVESLEWDEEGEYWVMDFIEGGEMSFRFISELINQITGVDIMANKALIDQAQEVKPLVDALANGKELEFRHNDGQWRKYSGCNLREPIMSPKRYRIKSD